MMVLINKVNPFSEITFYLGGNPFTAFRAQNETFSQFLPEIRKSPIEMASFKKN